MHSKVFRILIVAALGVMVALSARTLRVDALEHYTKTQRYEDVYYLPPAHWLTPLSFGYREALADLLWLRSLIYFGDEVRHRGQVQHLADYANAILELDPYFKPVYRWAGMSALYRTGSISEKDASIAVDFLERGVRKFPDDGELAWDLGATLRYEVPALLHDPQQREAAKRKGTEYLAVAARLGAGPPWLVLANATDLRKLGRTEQAIRHLEEMFATVQDPDIRAQIEIQLETFRSAAYREAFVRTTQELEAQRQRDFPYVSTGLMLFLGKRPVVDCIATLKRRFVPEDFRQTLDENESNAH